MGELSYIVTDTDGCVTKGDPAIRSVMIFETIHSIKSEE